MPRCGTLRDGYQCTAAAHGSSVLYAIYSTVLCIRLRYDTVRYMNQPEHGTVSTYTNWKCRCEACRAANAKYVRERREVRRVLLAEPPEPALCVACRGMVPAGMEDCPECGQNQGDYGDTDA